MIVGTAGHVDHGKTSLVRALTGIDTDRLAEEKARGISIELGFAYAHLDGDAASEPVGFVDVPGHRRFVQTMIAGAAGIDVGLLVVAADDGPMPQTREHLAILSWLGVDALIVALSKVDAVDADRRDAALAEVHEALAASPYAAAPVVPVSTVSGEGLDALRATLRDRERAARRPAAARFRLATDRVFALQGIGLVVTGTCVSGQVALDDHLTLLPSRLAARVRSIHAQDRAVALAHAGQRVALNLVGRGVEKGAVHRGDWIVADDVAIVTDRIDAVLAATDPAQWSDEQWRSVRFHAGATSVNARVTRLVPDAGDASPMLVQIAFESSQHLVAGDRFVLRDASIQDDGAASLAGGVVLDVDVPARGRRSAERLGFLATAAIGDAKDTLAHAVAASPRGVDLARWNVVHNSELAADAIDARLAGAATLMSHARWDALLDHVVARLADEHARAPDAVGPGRDRLRRMTAPALDAATFASVVDALKADGRITQTGAWLHLPSHRVELSDADRARFARARDAIDAAVERFNPPRVRDLARAIGDDEAALRSVFVRLAARGEVYKIAHDHYFPPATVRELARIAADLHANDGMTRAAPFRDRLGIGRKVAIQILEFFDRVGYTRRVGDDHRVVQPGLFDA